MRDDGWFSFREARADAGGSVLKAKLRYGMLDLDEWVWGNCWSIAVLACGAVGEMIWLDLFCRMGHGMA